MKLTVFAGTFNPIHTAHLIMAESIADQYKNDKILFIPAYNPPHKDNGEVDPMHRLSMVKLAIQDNPRFQVSDIEFQLQGTSYTIYTIRKLYELMPDIEGKIGFIIGTDAYNNIQSWHKSEELIELLDFKVVDRSKIDISSSSIREKIKKGESIRYLVPERVREYIYEQRLYL